MAESSQVRLLDVDALELRELTRSLPEGSYEVEHEEMGGTEHGDLGMTALLIVLAPVVLKGLSAWLMKARHKKTVSLRFQKILPDGTIENREVTLDTSSSDPAGADVIEQLTRGLDLDPSVAKAAIDLV